MHAAWNSNQQPDQKHPPLLSREQTRLEELHRLWELLLQKTKEKGLRLLQAQKLVQYLRECEDALDWISDKVRVKVTTSKPLNMFAVVC